MSHQSRWRELTDRVGALKTGGSTGGGPVSPSGGSPRPGRHSPHSHPPSNLQHHRDLRISASSQGASRRLAGVFARRARDAARAPAAMPRRHFFSVPTRHPSHRASRWDGGSARRRFTRRVVAWAPGSRRRTRPDGIRRVRDRPRRSRGPPARFAGAACMRTNGRA